MLPRPLTMLQSAFTGQQARTAPQYAGQGRMANPLPKQVTMAAKTCSLVEPLEIGVSTPVESSARTGNPG
jgi:hypothetical protein